MPQRLDTLLMMAELGQHVEHTNNEPESQQKARM
jgi:hypothetical protein